MKSDDKHALIRDIFKLLKRYPVEVWLQVLNDVQHSALVEPIRELVQIAGQQPSGTGARGKTSRPSDPLLALRSRDPNLASTLAQLRARAKRKEILSTPSELREFAHQCGIKEQLPEKREAAIATIVRFLATLPAQRVAALIIGIRAGEGIHGDDFERWARLIMQGEKKPDASN